MMIQLMISIHDSWYAWLDLFDSVPYGDPYVACATMFVILVAIARLAVNHVFDG